MFRKFLLLTLVIAAVNIPAAEKSKEEHTKALSSGTDAEKVEACNFLGNKKKDKTSIDAIIETLKNTDSAKVGVSCAVALGYIGQKGKSITALKDKIQSTDNTDIVYAALLAIYNISMSSKTLEDDAKTAYEYAKTHHAHDPYIADAVSKLESKKKGG